MELAFSLSLDYSTSQLAIPVPGDNKENVLEGGKVFRCTSHSHWLRFYIQVDVATRRSLVSEKQTNKQNSTNIKVYFFSGFCKGCTGLELQLGVKVH